jgi:hypothetical protein
MTEKVDGCGHRCEKAMSTTGYAYAWRHINRELLLPRLQHPNETWSRKIVRHHLDRIYAQNSQTIVGAIHEFPPQNVNFST